MITPTEMRERVLERPFRPFRVILKDGRQFDVHDPIWTLVGEPVVLIGIAPQDDPQSRYPDRHEWIAYQLIDKVELLPASTSTK